MKQHRLIDTVQKLALYRIMFLMLFGIGLLTPANADILVDAANLARALPSAAGRDLKDRRIADQYQQQFFFARLRLGALAKRADQHFEDVNQTLGTALPKIQFQALGRIRLRAEAEDYRQRLEMRSEVIDRIIDQHGLQIPLEMPSLPSGAGRDLTDPNVFAKYVRDLTLFDLLLLVREELSAKSIEAGAIQASLPVEPTPPKRARNCQNTQRLVWETESRPQMVRNFDGTMSMQTRSVSVQRWRNFNTCQ